MGKSVHRRNGEVSAIRTVVDTASFREHAENIGEKFRQEDSMGAALAFIEQQMTARAWTSTSTSEIASSRAKSSVQPRETQDRAG